MEENLEAICASLDDLSNSTLSSWNDERRFNEVWDWQAPPMSRHDLANIPKELSDRIKKANIETLDDDTIEKIEDIPNQIKHLKRLVSYLYNGNGHKAVPAYVVSLIGIEKALSPLFSWESMADTKALPSALARRLRAIKAEIEELAPDKEALTEQIRRIEDATAAADSLPTDLQTLKEARNKVDAHATRSTELCALIEAKEKEVAKHAEQIKDSAEQTQKLVALCEEAYRITTTKGLAAAFDKRAEWLQNSMTVWVVLLMGALGIAAFLGTKRVEVLHSAISAAQPQWGVIGMHIVLSALSVGIPLWFAWLATKQVGQRFRLAEDYAYKASVAKAYEGYRKEAARLDKAFESRLFDSALTRLEEAPLRLVNNDNHGSPWHELFESELFRRALDVVPGLKEKYIKVGRKSTPKESGESPEAQTE